MSTVLSPALLVSSAMSLVDGPETPVTPRALIARYLACTGGSVLDEEERDWSVPFVHYAGRSAHSDMHTVSSSWPLPPEPSADALRDFAESKGVLVAEAPRFGDVYLSWSPAKSRYVRAGIVLSARPKKMPGDELAYDCNVIDGDTDHHGRLHGPCTLVHERRVAPDRKDRLVRWVDLELVMAEPLIMGRAA